MYIKEKSKNKIFLTAKWENLIELTYKAGSEKLQHLIPPGVELETIDDKAFVSLVAFDFMDTAIKGIPIPFYGKFPEINLRFYVKTKEHLGIVFIREYIPKTAAVIGANVLYKEHYKYAPMISNTNTNGKTIKAEHKILIDNREFHVRIECNKKSFTPAVSSIEHFLKQRDTGFVRTKKGSTLLYKVEHDIWEIYPVIKYETNFDFEFIYGKEWGFLNNCEVHNAMLAKGSGVKVYELREL